MVTSRDDVANSFFLQELLEVPFASPGKVLSSLIRQHFFGLPKATNAIQKGRHDELARLAKLEIPCHDVSALVVHEDR